MHDAAALRAGLRVSMVSLVWTTGTSAAAIALGVTRGSLVLVAFGLTGVLDGAGSAAIVVNFRHAIHHEVLSERLERTAHRIVAIGLVAVGTVTTIESVRRLFSHPTVRTSRAGVTIAAVSILVLTVLSFRKRRLGGLIPSPALTADGWLSLTGALLAVITVAGTALASTYWWVDPVSSLFVALAAVAIAWRTRPPR